MTPSDSVTAWIRRACSADPAARDDAVARIWDRYSRDMLAAARALLGPQVRAREDEHDIAQNAYLSFCRRLDRPPAADRNELRDWLIAVAVNKARKAVTRHSRGKRDVRRQTGGGGDAAAPGPVAFAAGGGPTPAEAAGFADEFQRLLGRLPPDLRQIALWKFEDRTNDEIAAELGCVTRTVERKVGLIRDYLGPHVADLTAGPPR